MEKFKIMDRSIISDINERLVKHLDNQLKKAVIEGLARKDFLFVNDIELINFIKNRCRIEDNIESKQRIFIVDETPFLMHDYNYSCHNFLTTKQDYKIEMAATLGTFTYI